MKDEDRRKQSNEDEEKVVEGDYDRRVVLKVMTIKMGCRRRGEIGCRRRRRSGGGRGRRRKYGTKDKSPYRVQRKKAKTPAKNLEKATSLSTERIHVAENGRLTERDIGGACTRDAKDCNQKLKQIAREVPSASVFILGYGLRVMLRKSKICWCQFLPTRIKTPNKVKSPVEAEAGVLADEDVRQLSGGFLRPGKKKAWAYHVAAILCKDYTLWVQAADSAAELRTYLH
jgi:hypothetical protein